MRLDKLSPYYHLADTFRTGKDTPRRYLERTIERLESLEGSLKAFSSLSLVRARIMADASSKRWKEGQVLSAIDGMPIGIKDIIETYDMPTGMGSPIYDGWMARRDAAVVLATRQAGAVILGKTKTTEFAGGYATDTRNPHDLDRTAGGSSAGSACAVGAGILPVALGTQVMGSIIRPASFCGAYGYKPTEGGINRGGSHDFHSHSCIGLLGASLEDMRFTARALVQRAGGDPGHPGLRFADGRVRAEQPRRLMLLETPGWPFANATARSALEAYLKRLQSHRIETITRQKNDDLAAFERSLTDVRELAATIVDYEGRWVATNAVMRDSLGVSGMLTTKLQQTEHISPDAYAALLQRRSTLRQQFDSLFKQTDGFICLAAPGQAPPGIESSGDPIFNIPASLLGVPALTLPMLDDAGMPLGVQLIGARGQDETLFSQAAALLALPS